MAEAEPMNAYFFECPLCDHAQKVTPRDDESMCPVCGALLTIFKDERDAERFAALRKSEQETTKLTHATNGDMWIVGHKATPTNMAA